MKNKTVLISGASIAGPALAFWLHRYGFEPTIVERATTLRPGGYAVDFRGAALRVLDGMGLLPCVQEKQTRINAITMVDENNRQVARMPDGFTSGELEILRGDLAAIFHQATRETTDYLFAESVAEMEESAGGVDVRFQGGRTRRFDLVVGADGLHSKVRRLAFGDETRFVRYLGYYVSVFTIPNYLAESGDRARRDIAQQKNFVREHFGHAGWEVPRLLNLMNDAPDFYLDSVSQVKMDRWSAGRTVLLGDAAWCASPLSGMGTGMAVVGAYVLAGELAAAEGDYQVAFRNYEDRMREFVAKCQGIADGATDWYVPQTRFRLWLSNQMWKILPYTPWKDMMIEVPLKIGNSIDLPDYSTLIKAN